MNTPMPFTTPNLAARTICIVDDDELVRTYIAVQLRQQGMVVHEAANSADLFALMERGQIDCVLMDFALASENGLFVQDQLRDKFVNAPPIIILSASDNQRTIIKAFRTGVSDYLIKKDLRIEELLQSLRSAIDRRARDDSFRIELEHLKRQSVFDELTGFYRRSAMDDMLAALLKTSEEAPKPFAILLIRVNEFDHVNDQAGHMAASQLVRGFAARLRITVRDGDVCGRYDAKTFLYIVDLAATRRGMETLAARLDHALRFKLDLKGVSLHVSASLGIAFHPQDGSDVASLLTRAELTLASPVVAHAGPALAESADEETDMMRRGDRRASPRHRVFKVGKVFVNGGRSVIDCTVRDLSDDGARIRLGASYTVPTSFELLIVGSGATRLARLVWQSGIEAGIAFEVEQISATAHSRQA